MTHHLGGRAAIAVVLAAVAGFVGWTRCDAQPGKPAAEAFGSGRVNAISIDTVRAMGYLKQLCALGPRVSGSAGMGKQQELIEEHFKKLGATVTWQKFEARQRSRQAPVKMANIIVSFQPQAERRVILCTHYDTRPIADQEPDRRKWTEPFVSANDGTSGVALFMELGHHLKDMKLNVGVDLVFFDGEEYIFDPRPGADKYFFGSEHFAEQYQKNRPKHRYVAGVLFDLFAGANPKFAYEKNSLFLAGSVTQEIWATAKELNEPMFEARLGVEVLDDHLALNRVGIPTTDIIDLDYPHWHRLSDTPENVSGETMARVSRVVVTWLGRVK
ncbi:MAG: M28 family peptidase [Gemmataceae bacterium]|nr:M28 family peptidase [Gemmataceae bacterium]